MGIEAKKISKRFIRKTGKSNTFVAVKETDFSLNEGEFVTLMGRSGSGKTTFLNMLCGILPPSSGCVFLDGIDIYSLPDDEQSSLRRKKMGVVPQGQSALGNFSVLENVMLPFLIHDELENDSENYALGLLEKTQIAHLRDVSSGELSGGEMRRMAIARALVRKPSYIFADEPTGDLDDENTGFVLSLLRMAADEGAGVFVVTHEEGVKEYADKVYTMELSVLKSITHE